MAHPTCLLLPPARGSTWPRERLASTAIPAFLTTAGFMHGGPSHIDTFDPKPLLEKLNGQKLPASLRNVRLQFTDAADAPLLASQRKFTKHGQSGIEVSDLFPNVARYIDDMAVIRSCHHEAFVHGMALNMMNTGSPRIGFPSMGSGSSTVWVAKAGTCRRTWSCSREAQRQVLRSMAPVFFRPRIRARSCATRAIHF